MGISDQWAAYKQQKFIPHSFGGWKSEIRVLALSGEDPLPRGRPCILIWQKGSKKLSSVSFTGALIPLMEGLPSGPNHLLISSPWGL